MPSSRRRAIRVLMLGAALAITAVWLAFDNPEVSGTSRGDYPCLAPWDTVLNEADNVPDGEPPPDGDEIGARCREAGKDRFLTATMLGAAAVVASLASLILVPRGLDSRLSPSRRVGRRS